MATLREWISRVWGMLRGDRSDRDLQDELRAHLELAADHARRAGLPPESAARQARVGAGSIAQAMEAMREQRGLPWLEDLVRDLRYASRMLARNPGFTIVSVISLAIGIGANCAVFSWADALLLRPLPVPRPGDVLAVGSPSSVETVLRASYRDYVDVRDRSTSFESLVAYTPSTVAFATEPDSAAQLRIGMLVSGNLFTAMGVEPQLGRTFRPEEAQVPGRDAVVILGHEFWERQFGADPSVLGRTVRLNGIDFIVVGVAPAVFTGLDQFTRFEFYAPLMMWPRLAGDLDRDPLEARDLRRMKIKGRLKPGVTIPQAQTELSVIAADLKDAYPDTNRDQLILVRTELQARIADAPPSARLVALLTLLAAAILFVACANVAGLLTSRAPLRAREIALRLAIGAGRVRVVRQLITESVLMTLVGGVLGLGVGYAGVALFRQFRFPTDLPVAPSFELDWRAASVSLVVALVSAVLCGLIPALQSTRADLTAVMKATDAAGFGYRRRWGRAFLVSGQVAASVVVLAVASFVFRGTQRLIGSGPGYRTDQLLIVGLDPGITTRYSVAQAQRFFEQAAERARVVPGVTSAALVAPMPMDGQSPVTIVPEGFEFPRGKESATVLSASADEHYFKTMGLPILQGRGFLATDTAEAPRVAVVNELLAGRYWPGQNPIGKRFRLSDTGGPWVEIVGVARASKYTFIMEAPLEFVYFPYKQRPQPRMVLLVESPGDLSTLVTPLREIVRSLDAKQSIYNVRTMEEYYRIRVITIFRVVITVIAAMGVMGLVLSMVGLYGLVAFTVGRRTREIGIRMAIGAGRSDVLRMVLRQGLLLAGAGLGIGLLASIGAQRVMAAAFPGGPSGGRIDVGGLLLVATGVLAVTLLAAFVPARRASLINPTEALRCE